MVPHDYVQLSGYIVVSPHTFVPLIDHYRRTEVTLNISITIGMKKAAPVYSFNHSQPSNDEL